ncbi:MAG: hypothetical protein HY363_04175 [Candidatus Aenigmarchaeota archaeon]|nr:hypothetical protein [Candidatus Aenigmarchaeota archaeon]
MVKKKVRKVSAHKKHKPETRVAVYCYKKELGKAPDENAFVLHDGRKLRTLYELIDELETMSDDAFHEYVTWERNDFANWINDVFGASDLGTEVRRLQSRFDAQRALLKHIVRELAVLAPPVEHKHDKSHVTRGRGWAKCVL